MRSSESNPVLKLAGRPECSRRRDCGGCTGCTTFAAFVEAGQGDDPASGWRRTCQMPNRRTGETGTSTGPFKRIHPFPRQGAARQEGNDMKTSYGLAAGVVLLLGGTLGRCGDVETSQTP